MKGRTTLIVVAVLLGLVGIGLGIAHIWRLPRTVTLAVGPAGLETHRYATALARASEEARDRIRYQIVTTSGAQESARLLEERKVNLAIVRSDYDLPANGQTIIVNTRRLVVIMAPQQRRGGIQKLADLKGKRIAVARLTDPNTPLVRRILAVAEIGEGDATLVEADLGELPELLGSGKVDAAIAVVVLSAPNVAEVIPQIAKRLPNGIRFVPLAEAEAVANRILGVETAELPAGIFGAGRPAEEVATVAISYRTMARSTMPEELAGQVARSIYDLRTRLARLVPVAFTSEAPDATTGARLPVHPGAAAFFEGETKTFLERYGELMYIGLWGASIVGSALTAFVVWFGRGRHHEGAKYLEEIVRLTSEVRGSAPDALAQIELRIDGIVAELATLNLRGLLPPATMESVSLALEHFRSVAESARNRVA